MISALKGIFKGRRRELCPFCFEYFLLRDSPFRCNPKKSACPQEPDPVLQKHWGVDLPVGKVLPAQGRYASKMCCADCGEGSFQRLCPECHSDLPHTFGDQKYHIFAVIGAKEAGKSHYIAVLIDQIKHGEIGRSLNVILTWENDDSDKRYNTDFLGPVFLDHRTIRATYSALAHGKVKQPLVCRLTWPRKDIFGRHKNRVAVLVFFDTAGEDLNDEDVMSTVNKYIFRSDGILLLIDPLQLPQVRDRLGGGIALPDVNTETADILTRTTRLIEKGRNLKATERISIPLAVAFSKFDAVKPLVDDQFQLNAAARHVGGFDVLDFQAINSEMMALLEDWGGRHLVHQVQTQYVKYGFFGLSALGCNPHGTNKIPGVLPRRVEDPFLWLLAENGLIRRLDH